MDEFWIVPFFQPKDIEYLFENLNRLRINYDEKTAKWVPHTK